VSVKFANYIKRWHVFEPLLCFLTIRRLEFIERG